MNGGAGGPDGLDNDNNYDDVSKPQFLPADHPLYKRVQAAFHKQLGDEFERAHLDYKDKSNTLRAIEREKEEVGVQVYGLQQQLADMQQGFEAARDNCNNIFKTREENEGKRASLAETLEFRKSEITDLRKKVERANTELSKLNFGLHSMKSHKEDLKSELKLTQRRTHRTEENIVNLEKEKREQDFLVDQMNEEIKRLSKRISDLDSQTIAQRGETEEAMMIMKEADDEMENIRTSIRNLMSHWKKALFEIEEKDKNLLKLRQAVQSDDEKNLQILSEIAGLEKNIREEQETQTLLGEKLGVNKNILSHYASQIKSLKEDQEKGSAQRAYLEEALQKTKANMKILEDQRDSLTKEITKIEDNIMELHTQTRLKQEEVIKKVSSYKSISKTTINLKKLMSVKENELEEKQIELARENNMVARINIDIMNTQNQLRQVEELKKEVNQERAAHEAKVDENEKKIKSNHEHHEKQMHDIAKFNREHDKAMQKQSIFSKGPSDAKHMHLKKETEEMQAQAKKAQGEFIKEQTIIVKREFYSNSLQEEISELKRKEIILEQKRLRLTNQLNQHKKEIERVNTSLKNFQNDMNKLNEYLAENYEKAKDLQNENINIDSEIAQKLKELEKEAVVLEVRIDRMKEEKAELLQQIVEAERQKLLWERKIAVEKEMQEKLNPNYGQADIEQIKKKISQIDNQIRENVSEGKPNTELLKRKIQLEKDLQERQNLSSGNTGIEQLKKKIHLMELDLNGVKRDQDEITLEMERIIKKKVSIQLKYSKGQSNNPAKITKEVQSLQDVLARSNKGLKELDNNLRAKNNDLQNLRSNLSKLDGAEMDLEARQDQIIEKKIERLCMIVETAGLQKRTRALEDIVAAGIKRASETQKSQLRQINEENLKLQQALKMFVSDNPRFGSALNRLIELEIEG